MDPFRFLFRPCQVGFPHTFEKGMLFLFKPIRFTACPGSL